MRWFQQRWRLLAALVPGIFFGEVLRQQFQHLGLGRVVSVMAQCIISVAGALFILWSLGRLLPAKRNHAAMTRYQMLRNAVAILAAPPNEQVNHLDLIFANCTGGRSAAGYGNYELAYDLEDALLATDDMLKFGEVSSNEVAAGKSLHEHILQYWEMEDVTFWRRESLFDDARWQEIRVMAEIVLNQLPNERRESEYTRSVER